MLAGSPAVAFIGASSLDAARRFYEGVLGLPVRSQDGFAVVLDAGGVSVRITQPPTVVAAPYTVLGFTVQDVGAEIAALAARGVVFKHYSFFGDAQDAARVWTAPSGAKVAWFEDPDGNLLSIQSDA